MEGPQPKVPQGVGTLAQNFLPVVLCGEGHSLMCIRFNFFPHIKPSIYLFPQAWVKVLEQVDVAAAETWSLEEIGMERASAAVSGARSNLFVSSWLGLGRLQIN